VAGQIAELAALIAGLLPKSAWKPPLSKGLNTGSTPTKSVAWVAIKHPVVGPIMLYPVEVMVPAVIVQLLGLDEAPFLARMLFWMFVVASA
jgi:hypothetical protein